MTNSSLKLHDDDYTGQGCTTKNGNNTLPTQPKAIYDTMCDAVIESDNNFDILLEDLRKEVENTSVKYDTNDFYGSLARGFYTITFSNIDLGYGYKGHIGVFWSQQKEVMSAIVSKKFHLNGSKAQYAVVVIMPKYGEKPTLGVFTDKFLKEYARKTKLGEDGFVLLSSHSGLLSAHGENVRWMVDKGLCVGYKLGCFYYFHKFTSSFVFPFGDHTKKELKRIEKDMWNVTI